jgi:glycosyltransferase involved in cell wall biosynthesis
MMRCPNIAKYDFPLKKSSIPLHNGSFLAFIRTLAMNLLMLSGDSSIAQRSDGAFYEMLRRFAPYWSRIDILTPQAKGATARVIHEHVYVHPSPWHRALQPLYIRQKGAQLLRERPYGLVVSHDFGFFYNSVGALMLLRGTKMPLVSEIHHVEGYPTAITVRERLWRATAVRYLPWLNQHVTGFRVVNRREVPDLLKMLGVPDSKIHVLSSLYLDLDTYCPMPDVPKTYDVLFVGRLAANKGVDVLLRAFARLTQSHPQATLALRGDGPLKVSLMAEAASLGIVEKLHFIPRQTDNAGMVRLYNSARMLVCASTVEGNPRVTAEAMACGTLVLSTPVGIMPELIRDGENGFLVARDADALAAAMRRVLDEPTHAAQMAVAGREAVLPYDANVTIRAYAEGLRAMALKM